MTAGHPKSRNHPNSIDNPSRFNHYIGMSIASDSDRSPALPGGHKWLVFFFVAVGIFMATLDGSIVNIALPAIMADLGVEMVTIQWVVMIYLFTITSLLLGFGRLSDILGRRRVYATGLYLFALGSLFCGLAFNASWLIASRFFQALGAAMIMACTPALVVDTFPEAERGRALGLVGSVVASGLTTGPLLGGLLTHYFSWRAIFYINIPIGLAAALAVNILLKGSRADISRPERFDWPGGLLLALSLGPMLMAMTHGYDWGYTSPPFLALLALAGVAAAALLWVETRVAHPILSRSLFAIRLFTLPIMAAVLLFASLFCLVFLMPFYLMHPRALSVQAAGGIMTTLFFALFVISPLSGSFSDRIGSRMLCTIGMGLLALALYGLATIPPDAPLWQIGLRLGLAGIGTALFIPPNSATAMSAVEPWRRGVASGTVAAARNLGMVLGVATAGAIFNNVFYQLSGGLNLKGYAPRLQGIFMEAFHHAMLAGAILAALGMVISYLRGPEGK